jgi:heme exporter protein C
MAGVELVLLVLFGVFYDVDLWSVVGPLSVVLGLGTIGLAAAAAEVGVLFTGLTIVSGSIWGRPTWGVWWTWDARLTSTAVLFLVYIGYLLLRAMVEEPEARARYAAVVGILGAANIPIVHFSVYWWRALHQPATILGPGRAPLSPSLGLPLAVNWVAFLLLFIYFLARRMEIARLEDEV